MKGRDNLRNHMVYADNAATTKMSPAAIKAMLPYMETIWGNPSSLYGAGQRAAEALQSARERIAACFGASAGEIYFTSGGSEADNQAIISAAKIGERKGKKHIISSAFEHHAVLHTLKKLEKAGFEIELLDVHENGLIHPSQVADAIREDTCLVTIMYANNEIGSIQPIVEIGAICKEKGVLFHTDAVQAAGHLPIHVVEQNIDMLSLSAHKFHGPKGIGVLYARKGIPLTNIIEGGAQERGKRGGTENVPAILGMATALEEACAHMEENTKMVLKLRNRLIEGLSKIPHSVLNGDLEKRLPGNVNFCFEGIEGESLLLLLDDKGICASSGSACTSGSLDPSHVLLAIGRPHEVAHGSLRLSLCEENTEEEVEYILQSVPDIVEYLRGISPLWKDKVKGKRAFLLPE
ncbi:cysteine desulfurase NifS [Succiniclasticum ruminis]|nr:cysteine desulfurase NifS [Succiniclasticum ruminis]